MTTNSVAVDVDVEDAVRAFRRASDELDDAATRTVRQLSVLAEAAQKKEAPEGAGRDVNLRSTIRTDFSRGGKRARIGATKTVTHRGDDVLLATLVTGSPTYSPDNPPPPLFDWADAKLGDASLGWAVSQAIANRGTQATFPNPYVDRSLDQWEDDVETVAGREVRDAMTRLFRG